MKTTWFNRNLTNMLTLIVIALVSAFFYVYNEAGTELWSDNLQTNIPTNRATGHGIIATKPPTGHAVIGYLLLIDYLAVYLGTLTR